MASISEAKNALSALIDRVKGGASILIVDRGRPVARLEPIGAGAGGEGARLDALVRQGLVRPGRGIVPRLVISTPPPSATKATSALQALLEERRSGR